MRGLWCGVGLGVTLALLPRAGQACWPWDPHVEQTMPLDGEVHPANASILVWGQVLDPEGLQATIDELPAVVTNESRSHRIHYVAWGPAYRTLALSLDPPPQPGQQVHLFGELCTPDAELVDEPGCADFELAYEAGPPEFDPPQLDPDLWYDVYDHGSDATSHSSCGSATARFSVDVRIEVDEQAPFPSYFEVNRRPRDAPGQWEQVANEWRLEPGPQPRGFQFTYTLEQIAALLPLADAFCFELRTEDVAGNAGPTVERCPPCHDQFGEDLDAGFISVFPDGAPTYTDEWIDPDGYCPQSVLDDGTGSSGDPAGDETGDETGDDPTFGGTSGGDTSLATGTSGGDAPADEVPLDRGCGCTASPSAPGGPAWGLGLGLLVLGALRRRGARP